ncbi:hypothetical protein [Bacillus sp. RO1]|uniref:hypothetical protein n=1 Tax=Bacillus sp. RO1 TaxID=2722703 RepID=UPI001456946C|nr:hypothetical protein [Bacillus sp. RO1]NLP52494.1 hypothetical protein [Bacillus sp. RO1]
MTHAEDKNRIHFPSINDLHDEGIIQDFINGIGKKVFIMTPSFPFVFIGKIAEVIEDYVLLDTQVTTIGELEKRNWFIHVHSIEAYYIETKGLPRIPKLMEDF